LSVNHHEKAIDYSMQALKIDRQNSEAILILGFLFLNFQANR
jgi:hypothetical protein